MTIMRKAPAPKRFAPKVILSADDLWLIRSMRMRPNGEVRTRYYETPSVWNSSPVDATIFTTYEAASAHMAMYHARDRPAKGWADGSIQVLDAVPLLTEMEAAAKARSTKADSDGDDGA